MNHRCPSITLAGVVLLGLTALAVVPAAADDAWIDQFNNTVVFYQQADPLADWQPYLDTVRMIREGLEARNDTVVQTAQGELIRMLTSRSHGINAAAADDLFQMMTSRDIESFHEVPVSTPEASINTPYDGGRPCLPGGCDYWRDDVFDAGAG
ncbi:hypothetical protein [Candidatus Nitrospira bockiana]